MQSQPSSPSPINIQTHVPARLRHYCYPFFGSWIQNNSGRGGLSSLAPLTMPRPTRRAQQLQHREAISVATRRAQLLHREACIAAIKRSGDYVDYVSQHFARRPLTPNPRQAQVSTRAWEKSVCQWRKDLRQPSAEWVWAARILAHLWHWECPECFCEGSHDGDCTRDWPGGGRGIMGDLPPFRGTELLGLMQLAKQMHLRTEGSPQSATHFPGAQSAA